MIIEIKNWEKYNPKRAQTTYTWLRLSNDIHQDQNLFGLDPGQKYGWIVLLCMASKKNTGEIDLGAHGISYFGHATGMKKDSVQDLFKIIEERGMAKLNYTETTPPLHSDVETTTPTNETNETRRTNETNTVGGELKAQSPPSHKNITFNANDLNEVLLTFGKEKSDFWLDLYDGDQEWILRELKKAWQYYALDNPRKKPKSTIGWSRALSKWLENGWSYQAQRIQGKPVTKETRVTENNAAMWDKIERGEL